MPNHGLSDGDDVNFYVTATGWEALYSQTYPAIVPTETLGVTSVDVTGTNTFTAIPRDGSTVINTFGYPAFSGTGSYITTPLTVQAHDHYYGYRAAEVMKLVRDVYGVSPGTLWRGFINTNSNGNAHITVQLPSAIARATALGLGITDLFSVVGTAPYMSGQVLPSKTITAITQANPVQITAASHGYPNGRRVKVFVNSGMTQLDGQFGTVANATTNTFELTGINSSGYTAFTGSDTAYAANGEMWDLMDDSEALNISDPTNYPTKYTRWSEVMANIALTGSDPALDFYTTSLSVDNYTQIYIPALIGYIETYGLGYSQYEGNYGFSGDGNLQSYRETQLREFIVSGGHSDEMGAVYDESYIRYIALGIDNVSKFVEAGPSSQFGPWSGVRFWPLTANGEVGDEGNPVWTAWKKYTVAVPTTYTVEW